MKTAYEGSVRSVGNAYIAGQIDEAQLKSFVVEARKFYIPYSSVLELHKANKLEDSDARLDSLQKALDSLQVMVTQLLVRKSAATQLITPYVRYRYAIQL
jgi:hypothetical protein